METVKEWCRPGAKRQSDGFPIPPSSFLHRPAALIDPAGRRQNGDLALAEAGSLAYHRTDVDLAELLETCRTAHRAGADAAGVSLTVTAGPVSVHADPDRLRQVLGNMVTTRPA